MTSPAFGRAAAGNMVRIYIYPHHPLTSSARTAPFIPGEARMKAQPSVIVFDVNETLSDMAPMARRFADIGAPELLAKVWFASLLRDGFALAAAGGKDAFTRLARGALQAALSGTELNRPADQAAEYVLSGLADLSVHPDVPDGVRLLRRHGLRLVTLTNGSADVAWPAAGQGGHPRRV